jgi:hypothetical protein
VGYQAVRLSSAQGIAAEILFCGGNHAKKIGAESPVLSSALAEDRHAPMELPLNKQDHTAALPSSRALKTSLLGGGAGGFFDAVLYGTAIIPWPGALKLFFFIMMGVLMKTAMVKLFGGLLVVLLAAGIVMVSCGKGSFASRPEDNWNKALDDYEKFVNEYAAFVKKYRANPTDMALVKENASMMGKAQQAAASIEKVKNELSGDALAQFTVRYGKLTEKMASFLK